MKTEEQIKEKLQSLIKLLDKDIDELTEIKTYQWIDALNFVLN